MRVLLVPASPILVPSILDGKRPKRTFHQQFMGAAMNLLQGTLDLLVLKALTFGPRHGYAVARWVRETTDGTLAVEEGALYTSLHRMERRGWLESEWGVSENNRRAKYYSLTSAGGQQLTAESRAWASYAEAVFKVLRAREAEA
jgi:PadR family transcriptional regulator, regulatory protein PadR